ncbi:MAG: hypothetical protein CXR30_18875 [Geobacter sp.]|nr:MAG: hypothetical protein CXR30_18875 [Geobacter sp.]
MRILIMFFIAICLLTTGCQKSFSETFMPVGKLKATIPTDRFRYVSNDYDYLLVLLKEKKFPELTRELSVHQEAPKQDIARETDAESALKVFFRTDPALEPLFTEWVSQSSDTYPAYLARGVYYYARAAEARGTATATQTSDAQFSGMERFLELSRKDFDHALAIREDILMPYCYLLRMDRTLPDGEAQAKLTIEKVIRLFPYSLNARLAFLTTLMPRWGGSLDQMESFVKASRAFYKGNPRLVLLEGRIDLERGDERMIFNNDYEGALKFYDKARQYGDHPFLLQQRGYALMWLERLDKAYADSKLALEMDPYAREALENKEFCVFNKPTISPRGLAEALEDTERLLSFDPNSEVYLMRRAGIRYKEGKYAEAIVDYDRVLQTNPANSDALRLKNRGIRHIQEGK